MAGLALASALTAACGNSGAVQNKTTVAEQNKTPQGREGRPSLSQFCGEKNAKVAYVVGFGDNSWRKVALAEVQDEAEKCGNVTVKYFDANNDQNQYISMINSATAQGFDAIITYDDFGKAAVPALRKAFESGVTVVPFEADPGGTAGTDYTGFVDLALAKETQAWGEFLSRALPKGGKLAYLGGTAGNPLSAKYWKDFQAVLAENPALKMQGSGPITTNWDPAESQKVVSGTFAQYPDTSALIADYLGGTGPGIVRSYQNARKPLPPVAGGSSTNELVCMWRDLHEKNPDFQLFSSDGDVSIGRVALRHAVAAVQGVENGESWVFERAVGIDTTKDIIPACDDKLPQDAPLASTFDATRLAEIFAK
ncbi:monosaccharide ABC transporter substrate-binding protein, CUT2 family [Actinomadura meyerae]|uniref:Monosaccharide ABC transporter substrate-binding protein, CUT2 family n=1 Tax=Actinomadura meyerae TaxID=240840 RepID=A0A239NFV4_9ACTN|nr:substrate-binding domain-containing protein [Actinomadura meyerae]SNT53412.1 monosaccharide ABC transporter substrate-binding protein, CUT2 family [Actinomadura meyerae]